jgi:hypothetical protein
VADGARRAGRGALRRPRARAGRSRSPRPTRWCAAWPTR